MRRNTEWVFRWAPLVAGVMWATACGGAQPEPPVTDEPPWFRETTAELGLNFQHDPGVDGSFFMPEIMGSGGALFDYDGDGDLDVYLINSGPHDPERVGRSSTVNRLFRHEDRGGFVDVTDSSGLGDSGYGMGCAVGDIDNDGDPDVYVTNLVGDALYRNEGDGTFADITAEAGISGKRWSTSAAFFDYDLDGFLDLYVTAYVDYRNPKACRHTTGRIDYCGPDNFAGVPDTLYRNNGDGTFTDVTVEAGLAQAAGKGLGVYAADFDGDGDDDVYVANDGVENHLWVNLGDGRFEDRAVVLGAAVNLRGHPEASMGIAVGDVDGDGDLDLFLTHLDRETNTFYRNEDRQWFEDATERVGLAADSVPFNGFGTEFVDLDHDGDLDLLAVNGRVRLSPDAVADVDSTFLEDYAESNLLFMNDGDGDFRESSARGGTLFSLVEVTRALLLGDIDGDGDPDALLTNCNGPARLFLNEIPGKGHWLRVRAFDPALGRDAIGAIVEVEAGSRRQIRHVTRTASYLGGGEPDVHFGLAGSQRVDRIRVRWPGGGWEVFPGVAADRVVRIVRGAGSPIPKEPGA